LVLVLLVLFLLLSYLPNFPLKILSPPPFIPLNFVTVMNVILLNKKKRNVSFV
jgi:hypothetical protein